MKFFVKLLLPAATTVLLLTAAAAAEEDDAKREFFPISTIKDYPNPAKALTALVKRDGKAAANHFCIVGLRKGTYYAAEVYWRENNTLTLWEPGDPDDAESLLMSRRTWNLKKDIIRTPEDQFSTYLLSQQDVDQTLNACQRIGEHFVILKKATRRKQ